MIKKPISADSHITEPPNCFIDYIDPAYRDTAPHIVRMEGKGDVYVIPGMKQTAPMGIVAAAGKDPADITEKGTFDELWRSGWDANYRIADQDRDGVAGELVYPTVGMLLCNHSDFNYKHACGEAYNRWLAEYCSVAPDRIFGLAMASVRTPEDGVNELKAAKAMGFKGVMMTGNPGVEDYDSPIYDKLWATAVELGLPLSFHILTSREDNANGVAQSSRGPRINGFLQLIRGNQDIIGMLIFSGVFDRHPRLKIVCAEADAGWAPHYMYRLDHAFNYHRFWMKAPKLDRMPSEYFAENIYLTFQDDYIAFQSRDILNINRLMWANDFPHSDATWPNSQALLDKQTKGMTADERNLICHDNVAELYGLTV